ncbi:MAG TPA: EcsC family protein [Lentimicrobium sp.]|jgi:uncharacterized protein (DUF697 family)|nr:EcsC family protein [Lentimicrobium sp.]
MALTLTKNVWSSLLDWAYDKALKGGSGMDKASELAMRYSDPTLTIHQQVDALISRQKILAGSSGFITGFGGIMAMPFTIPANFASVLFIQIRMIAAIAYIGGFNLEDKEVKQLIIACMAGNAAKDVGFTILRRYRGKGIINLGKGIPLAGGIIGGSIDVATTAVLGRIARMTFIEKAS